MKSFFKVSLPLTIVTLIPTIAFAAEKRTLRDLVELVLKYFNMVVILIIALGVVMFVWNVYKYFIAGSDNAESKKEAGLYVMWSLIGFFVILSFWGLVAILTNTFKLENSIPSGFFGSFRSSGSSGSVFQPNIQWQQGVNNPVGNQGVNNPVGNQGVNNGAANLKPNNSDPFNLGGSTDSNFNSNTDPADPYGVGGR